MSDVEPQTPGRDLTDAIQAYWQDHDEAETNNTLVVRWICVAELHDPADDTGFSVSISGTPDRLGGCTYAEILGMLEWATTVEKAKITHNYFNPEQDED